MPNALQGALLVLCHLNRIGALHLPSAPGPSPPEQEVFGWGQLSNEESTGMELYPIQCETLIELGKFFKIVIFNFFLFLHV